MGACRCGSQELLLNLFTFLFLLYFGTLSPVWPFQTKCALPRIEIHYSTSEKEMWVLDWVHQTTRIPLKVASHGWPARPVWQNLTEHSVVISWREKRELGSELHWPILKLNNKLDSPKMTQEQWNCSFHIYAYEAIYMPIILIYLW